jgi:hypothetical protein
MAFLQSQFLAPEGNLQPKGRAAGERGATPSAPQRESSAAGGIAPKGPSGQER